MENIVIEGDDLNSPNKEIDNWKPKSTDLINKINKLFSVIEKRNSNWAKSKNKLKELDMINNEGICTLNVGGTLFQTSIYTLKKLKGTLFYHQLLSNEITVNQVTFYDRDPDLFHIIINYLRTLIIPDIESLSKDEKEKLLVEAEYYLITPLINILNTNDALPPNGIQSILIEGSNYQFIKGNKNTILNIINNQKGIIMRDIASLTIKYCNPVKFNSFLICGLDLESIPFNIKEKWDLLNEENKHMFSNSPIKVLSSIDNENWIEICSLSSINEFSSRVIFKLVTGQYIKFCLDNDFFHISFFKIDKN